ncbi:hypothetical protein [Ferruginibacter sp. SUN106]|uniref:hypothetical protein n=1 Tax=Ferruginibacter sp. SUN106 TaxID=2978348 RepID=UPI003D36C30B
MKDLVKTLIVLGTLLINAFLIYALLYDPLSQVLLDKNQPYRIPDSNIIVNLVTYGIIGLLIITSVLLAKKVYHTQRIFYPAPLLTLAVIATIFIVMFTAEKYPSSISQYEKEGYFYKIEIWWNTRANTRTYKRWKSIHPYDGKSNTDTMRYQLDSLSKSEDN